MKKPIKSWRWKSSKVVAFKQRKNYSVKVYPETMSSASDGDLQFDVSFQQAIWPVIVGAQICGLMPVCGVRPRRLWMAAKFKWRSARTMLTLVTLLSVSIVVYMFMHRLHQAGFTAKNLG